MNYAYLLHCGDGTFYAGWTNNLSKRLQAHRAGSGAKYTRGRGPISLAWAKGYPSRHEAMAQEAALKKMTHAEKAELAKEYGAGYYSFSNGR